jgi:hypothetical protein
MSAINWAAIDWVTLVTFSLFVLIAYNIGERLSFGSRVLGGILTALVFALGFAVWSYTGLGAAMHNAVAAVSASIPRG